ncbi:hypothetical protein LMH87_001471 [Akanthomyces muscarius]|uniref:Uncharacterized protein n=1 Tax=Akanthomyces muscarius TaxID=2231603 RepID=A0A9W8Q6D7_AKAMU|nr:hypothetical protein LMH87_001471 [Akanthomyces muscarius]KAJ4146915.1 hypothetical protein LMH87_001471 [Akanthomyces muscarius]
MLYQQNYRPLEIVLTQFLYLTMATFIPVRAIPTIHDTEKTEVVASKNPRDNKPDENLYPACQVFMGEVLQHLKSTKVKWEGTFTLSSDDLQSPASRQYLLRLRNKDEDDCIESKSQIAFSLAVPYFIGTKQIQLSDQGQDWRLNWPSNKVLVFVEELRLLSDGHLQIHVQSFKKVLATNT